MTDDKVLQTGESPAAEARFRTNQANRILVVDDDMVIRNLNAQVLSLFGYQTETAEDGAAAWETLQANRYDLLITDNKMAKVSGVELLKKLRSARMALPVIMATGTLPREEFSGYPWLQPVATLLKPFTFAELLGAVREILAPPTVSAARGSNCSADVEANHHPAGDTYARS
jgi:DNA-binding NtrC family response regulator